ncbi:zinc finger protein CONSTANS-LIKE 7 [Ipomoea triloba]|uniref:zinc finger protein CONSTANS-LIKE 7 n=1 Tax=Ipomoea triloba TaxID=35885 RepID=UPI00125D5F93|nr:zinc finger protein CONSTANS-LIKE 7 [Ipomoea triloba]
MGRNWGMPWSPKKEEQEVPDPDITCSSVVSDNHCHRESNHTVDHHHPNKHYFSSFMDDMELDDDAGDDDDDINNSQAVEAAKTAVDLPAAGRTGTDAYWDFEFTCSSDHDGGLSSVNEDSGDQKPVLSQQNEQESMLRVKSQEENNDDDEYHQEINMAASLNLSLNYQHVLDAWSDRGTLWAHDNTAFSLPNNPNNHSYMGEVPVMDNEERSTRREASVMRYKEKRQTRLFSKKIRYQVRKLNAEKRPRLKGRFVRKASDGD